MMNSAVENLRRGASSPGWEREVASSHLWQLVELLHLQVEGGGPHVLRPLLLSPRDLEDEVVPLQSAAWLRCDHPQTNE